MNRLPGDGAAASLSRRATVRDSARLWNFMFSRFGSVYSELLASCVMIRLRHGGGHKPFCSDVFSRAIFFRLFHGPAHSELSREIKFRFLLGPLWCGMLIMNYSHHDNLNIFKIYWPPRISLSKNWYLSLSVNKSNITYVFKSISSQPNEGIPK